MISLNKTDNLCVNCWSELTSGSVCTKCGYDNDKPNSNDFLPQRYVLAEQYVIGTVVMRESDAVTYLAYDLSAGCPVEVREFLPKGMSNRLEGNNDVHVRERYKKNYGIYKKSFINLWNTIAGFKNLSAVMPVKSVFEFNNTAYTVYEHMETVPLREFLLRAPEGNISWDKARIMFMPVLTTLEALHDNGIIHGSITPDNLVLCRDGKIRLKDFCISECNNVLSEMEFNVNDGYTAIEQYDNNHKICPATDIYAFSACVYRALVGTNPPDAPSREINDKLMIPNRVAEAIPTYVIKALGSGLQIYPEKRCQSVSRLRELLNAAPSVVAAAAPEPQVHREREIQPPVQQTVQPKTENKDLNNKDNSKRNKIIIIILIVLIAAAVAAGIYVVKFSGIMDKQDTTASTAAQTYTVPDFVSAGYTQSDVQNNGVWNDQFKITFSQEYSTSVEEGIIFNQSIEKGKTVEKGTSIVLTVSKGVQTETIPDVGGLKLEDAQKTLADKGFKVSTVEVYNDGSNAAGTVKAQYGMAPAAGTSAPVESEVVLQVYGEIHTTTQAATTTQPTTEAEGPIVE